MYFVKTFSFGRPFSRGELGISSGSSQNTTSCWDVSWTSFWHLFSKPVDTVDTVDAVDAVEVVDIVDTVDAVEPPDSVDVGEAEPALW